MSEKIFKNRQEAGKELAQKLGPYKNSKDAVILALPRGGVVVGSEIAQELNLPLDIVVPRKIGAPQDPEYAIGAITESGDGIFNEAETKYVDKDWLRREVEKEKKEALRRLKLYRGERPTLNLKDKIVILVDDGVATGYTMRAALKSVHSQNPKKIIVAVPHGAPDSLALIRKEANEVVALSEPAWYGAVGAWYKEFPQTSDEEVIQLLTTDKEPIAPHAKTPKQKNLILFLVVAFLLTAVVVANELEFPHTSFLGTKSVEIKPGLGSRAIAEVLKREGIIRSKWAFIIYVSLLQKSSYLKPGNYVFFSTTIIPDLVQDLVRGGTNEIAITIPEGWSIKEIAEYLERNNIISRQEFLDLTVQHRVLNRFDFLKDKPTQIGLEGYLFPDTYRIFKDAKPDDIVIKMLENFGRKLTPDLRIEISRRNLTLFDVVRMASLIEKEVVSDEDRALVSGVLWKRLESGIGLQVDATISYITGKKTTKISREETEINSPYNTYKYRGLPPGPISNPGLSAIRAAIYPENSPYLYYLSTPDGRTVFSKTLEEHNEAKTKYLK